MPTTVAFVHVETQADGSLVVRWTLQGEPAAVDVATGPTPSHVDHDHQATVPAGRWELQIPGAPGRKYVSVAPHGGGSAVVAADRRIPFEGITNFRDLGGYPSGLGGAVRWGLVFRADALHGLSSSDLDLYADLGLRAVYDLRGEVERNERPDPFPSRHLALISRPSETEELTAELSTASNLDGQRFLHKLYATLIESSAAQIGELLSFLAREGGLPAVFHCHAGKDRTGLVAAVLLEALGVERNAVLDDYELTARYRLRRDQEPTVQRLLEYGMSPEAAAGVLATPRWAMREALEEIDCKFGGIENYLTGPAGMSRDDLLTLRRVLLPAA